MMNKLKTICMISFVLVLPVNCIFGAKKASYEETAKASLEALLPKVEAKIAALTNEKTGSWTKLEKKIQEWIDKKEAWDEDDVDLFESEVIGGTKSALGIK